MESTPGTDTCQDLKNQIAELIGICHIGLASPLVHEFADESGFAGIRRLQEALVLIEKLPNRSVYLSQVRAFQEPFQSLGWRQADHIQSILWTHRSLAVVNGKEI